MVAATIHGSKSGKTAGTSRAPPNPLGAVSTRLGLSAEPRRRSAIILGLTVVGSVKLAWSFSAFTVLVYYALTNLAALRIPAEARIVPRWVPVAGLIGCLGLAFWVEWRVWAVGLGMIAAGLVWQQVMRRLARRS